MIQIRESAWNGSGDNPLLAPNFRESEFYHKGKASNHPEIHDLHALIPDAAQILRDYYGQPLRITSPVRYPGDNHYNETSQHNYLKATAFDSQFINDNDVIMPRFHGEILYKGELFQTLYSMGVRGFGLYDTFIHLDFRNTPDVVIWDKRITTAGNEEFPNNIVVDNGMSEPQPIDTNTSPIDSIISSDVEDGGKKNSRFIRYLIVALFVLAFFLFIIYYS